MPQAKLRPKAQITIPKEIIEKLNLSEGEIFDVSVSDGRIVLRPQVVVPKDEAWLYTAEAQATLKRGLEDIAAGRTYGPFDNADDLIHSLDS